jgi:hypothetical protein
MPTGREIFKEAVREVMEEIRAEEAAADDGDGKPQTGKPKPKDKAAKSKDGMFKKISEWMDAE